MDKSCILNNLDTIIEKSLGHHNYTMNESLTPKDVQGWDSLVNAVIITSVEKEFGIKFKFSDIISWKNVGELCSVIQNKLT